MDFFLGLEESLGNDNKFVKLNKLVDFNKFRKTFKGIYTQDITRQGRPAFDCLMMFKLLLLTQQSFLCIINTKISNI